MKMFALGVFCFSKQKQNKKYKVICFSKLLEKALFFQKVT
jgi:hypothetical protein